MTIFDENVSKIRSQNMPENFSYEIPTGSLHAHLVFLSVGDLLLWNALQESPARA
jgi:hypothetical protein